MLYQCIIIYFMQQSEYFNFLISSFLSLHFNLFLRSAQYHIENHIVNILTDVVIAI